MKFATKALVVGFMMVTGVAIAAEATDPTVKARQELMDTIAMNTGILGKMAGGENPFDAAAAEHGAQLLPAPLAPPWSHGWRIAWPNTPAAQD